MNTLKAFTDYPIVELGDTPGEQAPIRSVDVLSYDKNKYCRVIIEGVITHIKAGYLYTRKGRCGDAPCVPLETLKKLKD